MSSSHRVLRLGFSVAALLLSPLLSGSLAQQPPGPLEQAPLLLPQADPLPIPTSTILAQAEIIYHDGQLTIHAQNSTLADVLNAVAEKTGAVIDIPPGSGQDRIVEQAGPGPADDVLSRVLNGSPFDFIILNSPESPHLPTRILLLPRAAGKPAAGLEPERVASASSSSQPKLYGAGFRVNPGDDDSSPDVAVSSSVAEASTPQGDVIPGDVLDQMQKDRLRQRQQQMQQQAASSSRSQ